MGVRSYSDGNADNYPRREQVFERRRRGPGDGIRILELKTSKTDEGGRKVRVALRKSKGHAGGVRIIEPKNRFSEMRRSRGNSVDTVSNVDVKDKPSKTRRRVGKDFKTKNGRTGFEVVNNVDFGRKRMRVDTDSALAENRLSEGNAEKLERKSNSRTKKEVARVHLDKGKKVVRVKATKNENYPQNTSMTGSKKIKSEVLGTNTYRGKFENARNLKHAQENGLGEGRSIRSGEKKAQFEIKNNLDRRKHAVDSVMKPHKNKILQKKSLITDSEAKEDPPKKKKRVIRIDPHDTSNKRLDDQTADDDNSQGKQDIAEANDAEMSKNALFRAIQPSSSILSFVEDNFLGRRRDIEFRRAGYNTELSAPLDNIPFSTNSERERIEVPVFRNKLEFFAAAKVSSSFPSPELPEIAFAGRSNVGKSSLLNSLTRQWGVVRTSDKPGLTQTINFFKLGTKLSLVDLPGYGFAYAKDEVKEAWEELVKEYVASRVGLKRVCLLIDTKWGMKPRDHELVDLMERSQTKYQIVLTKTDLVFPIDVARRAMQIEEQLKANKSAVQPLMMVSSKTGAGIRSLRTVLANVARFVRR